MEELQRYSDLLLKKIEPKFFRFLYKQIHWEQRMLAIKGPRGSGKTTLMLQRIKFGLSASDKALYVTADHPYFFKNSLFELADTFYKYGGQYLFIDEVHKYPHWARELKVIYDGFPELKVVFSASSALDIYRGESDLSRRVITYFLLGMSFREYLEFIHEKVYLPVSLSDLTKRHRELAQEVVDSLVPLPLFKNYLQYGYLPIVNESNEADYISKLNQIVNTTIDTDLAYVDRYTPGTALKLKKLLGLLSESSPYRPNISALSRKLEISRDSVYTYLKYLKEAGLINFLLAEGKGISLLQKPDKVYLENTNLAYVLKSKPDVGNLRETFLLNQLLNSHHRVTYPKAGDFFVNDYHIEVGGKNKTKSQVVREAHPVVAADDIETGFGNKIPLWLFGFLY